MRKDPNSKMLQLTKIKKRNLALVFKEWMELSTELLLKPEKGFI